MKKIEKFYLSALLKLFLIVDIASIAIFVVVNFFERLSFFISNRAKIGDIALFYFYQIPYLASLLAPFSFLIAIFFMFQESAEKRELIVLKTSGADLRGLLGKVLGVSFFLTVLLFLNNEFLGFPGLRKSTFVRKSKIEKSEYYYFFPVVSDFSFMSGDTLFYFSRLSARGQRGNGLVIMVYRDGKVVKRIDADSCIIYKNSYELFNVTERIIGNLKDSVITYDRKVLKGVVSPFEVLRRRRELEEMSARELYRVYNFKKKLKLDYNEELVEFLYRFSFPLTLLVFAFFSLPMAVSIRPKGRTYAFGIALLLSFALWAFIQFMKVSGQVGKISPFISIFLPLFLPFFLGLFLWGKVRL